MVLEVRGCLSPSIRRVKALLMGLVYGTHYSLPTGLGPILVFVPCSDSELRFPHFPTSSGVVVAHSQFKPDCNPRWSQLPLKPANPLNLTFVQPMSLARAHKPVDSLAGSVPRFATLSLAALESLLNRCYSVNQFNQVLSHAISTGFLSNTYAVSKVLTFAAKTSWVGPDYSSRVLNQAKNRNGFMWNVVMRAFVGMDSPRDAILLYKRMCLDENEVVRPDKFTYPILIHGCGSQRLEFEGREIQGRTVKLGFDSNVYVVNTLINMYGVCGNMADARKVFDKCPSRDSVSWNSLLAGYVQAEMVEEAKLVFDGMPIRNLIASNSMIVLLGKTGCLVEARELFDCMGEKCMVSWSALISCYENNRMYEKALITFREMHSDGVLLDEVVLLTVLSCSAEFGVVDSGKLIHGLATKIGIASFVNLQNALIHMYSKCDGIKDAESLFNAAFPDLDLISWNSMISGYMRSGCLKNARALFDLIPERDLVSWSAVISGYAQHDLFSETLDLFQEMQLAGIHPDEAVLVSVLSACTHLSALEQGKWVHAYIKKEGLVLNVILGTTLLDMYMKCGCVENALDVFHAMEERGVSTWNALILGLAMNGLEEKSLTVFSEMRQCGILPNDITFMGVLGACRHMGLVDEGRFHFDLMTREYNIKPNVKHYGCMVDLLGRAGKVKEAEELLKNMPMAPDVSTWGALLGACRKHGYVEMGERVGRKLIELQPDHDGFHILLSNVYASRGRWEDVIVVRDVMTQQSVVKTPGCSMIQVNGEVNEFLAGDRSHPQMNEIKQKLDEMLKKIKSEGYVPHMGEVFLEIDEEEKETSLLGHSEKLALAFGLLRTAPDMPIRIMKNLRICTDCHAVAKFVSRAYDRDVIIRDRHRFHHFKHGHCSCMDFW